MYDDLITALTASNIPFAEFGWDRRPSGAYGVYQLDQELDTLNGDDLKQERAIEGSVDFFTPVKDAVSVAAIEAALDSVCEASWTLNGTFYENETHLFHYEWIFRIME